MGDVVGAVRAVAKVLTVVVDFAPGSRFAVEDEPGVHPVHNTVTKAYRHLNFYQHECHLQVRTPRVKLPTTASSHRAHLRRSALALHVLS